MLMMLFKYESLCTFLMVLKFGLLEGYLIGEQCKYDDDCFVDHSFCEMQQICECKENFIASADGESCIALIGAHCHSKYDCTTLPNSVCKEDRCVCDQGYVPDPHQTKCIQMAKQINDRCETDLQCRARLGKESHCLNRQCHCFPGYHFENQCVQTKGLREQCRNNSQCFIGKTDRHAIVCSAGYCNCAPGYHENESFDLCLQNGSPNKPRRLLTILICILLIISL